MTPKKYLRLKILPPKNTPSPPVGLRGERGVTIVFPPCQRGSSILLLGGGWVQDMRIGYFGADFMRGSCYNLSLGGGGVIIFSTGKGGRTFSVDYMYT